MNLTESFQILPVEPDPNLFEYPFDLLDWNADQSRRTKFPAHAQTRNFAFRKVTSFDENPDIVDCNLDCDYRQLVMTEVAKLEEYFQAHAVVVTLAGIEPGGVIAEHRDQSPLFHVAHRCHLPLVTHPDVEFIIDGKSNHFKHGVWYEIDNRRLHSVKNRANILRVHLLVDLLPM